MKIAQFFAPKKRRAVLALTGVFLALIAVRAFAHGGRGDWRGHERIGGWTRMTEYSAEGDFPSVGFRFTAGGRGGYVNTLSTITEAQTLANKTPIRLRGTIEKALKNGGYEFHDNTGNITVEMLPGAWNGVTVTAGDAVEITGWIRKPFSKRTVLVTQVQKLQSSDAE